MPDRSDCRLYRRSVPGRRHGLDEGAMRRVARYVAQVAGGLVGPIRIVISIRD